jgi:predicted Zn-dependent protease
MTSKTIASLVETPTLLSEAQCRAIADRVMESAADGGETAVEIRSEWQSGVRWARNRVTAASDRGIDSVTIRRRVHRKTVYVSTNQIDDASLVAALRAAERDARHVKDAFAPSDRFVEPAVTHAYPRPLLWSDRTVAAASACEMVARSAIDAASAAAMVSAGYASVAARATAYIDSLGRALYTPQTFAEYSTTVRDPRGLGSGWAGMSSFDWGAIDPAQLAARALDKGRQSLNPVVIEPGRYTLIMEPQAVADLLTILIPWLDRGPAESREGPFAAGSGGSKLGQRVIDARISIDHDTLDPLLGVVPFADEGDDVEPMNAARWIEHGVLQRLAYPRSYALSQRHENEGVPLRFAYRMSGGETSIEAMVASTVRGLLVTRFHGTRLLDTNSLLSIGNTRDGLWLIENGRITKPVKSLRFTESPLFALNNVEQLGPPTSVLGAKAWSLGDWRAPTIVPALKVRDFSFTSVADAV